MRLAQGDARVGDDRACSGASRRGTMKCKPSIVRQATQQGVRRGLFDRDEVRVASSR
jgi:hypothetical protein